MKKGLISRLFCWIKNEIDLIFGLKGEKNKLRNIILFILIIGVIIYGDISYDKEERLIKDNHEITIGKLEEYSKGGLDWGPTVTYSYIVDGNKYERTISANSSFIKCENFLLCKDNRYWVIYYPDEPFRSLINLSIDLKDVENPVFPKALDGFELPRWRKLRDYF